MNLNEEYVKQWFSLSYSSYLVLPRLFLESMPSEWQKKFIELLEEIPEVIKIREDYTGNYTCNYKVQGKFSKDPYRDYRRGVVDFKNDRDD